MTQTQQHTCSEGEFRVTMVTGPSLVTYYYQIHTHPHNGIPPVEPSLHGHHDYNQNQVRYSATTRGLTTITY